MKLCECGCGIEIPERDKKNRPRRFVAGHHNRLRDFVGLPDHLQKHKFQKGIEPWNKGKHPEYCQGKNNYFSTHSFNNGKKISEKLKGKIPKNIDLLLEKGLIFRFKTEDVVGEKNNNWKGGITPINRIARGSKKYFTWRKMVFERDNYTCRECNKRGGNLEAHHIKAFALFTDLRYDLDNGITYCVDCHKKLDKERK